MLLLPGTVLDAGTLTALFRRKKRGGAESTQLANNTATLEASVLTPAAD